MNELWIAAALTFAASAHCLGMCGGLMVTVAARGERPGALRDFLLLQLGKGTTYAFLGALAGLFGAALTGASWFVWSTRVLTVVAALALASAGLTLLGRGRRTAGSLSAVLAPFWSRLFGPLLESRPAGFPLVVGLAMGFFPCPLVYAGLAAAAVTASPGLGAITLVGVALGSLPALAMASLFTNFATLSDGTAWRRLMTRSAGALLILMAAVTLSRALPGGHGDHGAHATAPAPGAPAEAAPDHKHH
jgi:sulfite exporter TauE/SafE